MKSNPHRNATTWELHLHCMNCTWRYPSNSPCGVGIKKAWYYSNVSCGKEHISSPQPWRCRPCHFGNTSWMLVMHWAWPVSPVLDSDNSLSMPHRNSVASFNSEESLRGLTPRCIGPMPSVFRLVRSATSCCDRFAALLFLATGWPTISLICNSLLMGIACQ